jgi:hypothetical protein
MVAEVTQFDRATITRWLARGRLTLLLDGFDELPPEDRDEFTEKLLLLRKKYSDLCIVYTSRSTEYVQRMLSISTVVARIMPLNSMQIKDFLGKLSKSGLFPTDDVQRLLEAINSRPVLQSLARSPRYVQFMLATIKYIDADESIESRVAEELFRRALRDQEPNNAWLAYRTLLEHASQPRVAQAAEALSDYFLTSGDPESAERAYLLASERFEPPITATLPTSEASPTERKILEILRPNVTYDLAQIISAASISPSETLSALGSLIGKGSVLRISAEPEPRYFSVAESPPE